MQLQVTGKGSTMPAPFACVGGEHSLEVGLGLVMCLALRVPLARATGSSPRLDASDPIGN